MYCSLTAVAVDRHRPRRALSWRQDGVPDRPIHCLSRHRLFSSCQPLMHLRHSHLTAATFVLSSAFVLAFVCTISLKMSSQYSKHTGHWGLWLRPSCGGWTYQVRLEEETVYAEKMPSQMDVAPWCCNWLDKWLDGLDWIYPCWVRYRALYSATNL